MPISVHPYDVGRLVTLGGGPAGPTAVHGRTMPARAGRTGPSAVWDTGIGVPK
ncbi:hypothetical protein [Plantactinospora sonchi]|uniref:Uncharacterized protein n=1 Tax=Plantactinospora sonchi TaxID=1544735 RepID=A0ABU7RSF7_9ACTN